MIYSQIHTIYTRAQNRLLYFIKTLSILLFLLTFIAPQLSHADLNCVQLFESVSCSSETPNQKLTLSKYEKRAEELGLTYVNSSNLKGYRRVIHSSRVYKKKDGSNGATLYFYRYYRPNGQLIRPRLESEEYQNLVTQFNKFKINPDWPDVYLSSDKKSHIQVIAKINDSKTGKIKNYSIYHPNWLTGSSLEKFNRVQEFGKSVPTLRDKFNLDLKKSKTLDNYKSISEASAFLLLMSGRIRVGNQKYLNENGTVGVTTLQKNQLIIDNDERLFLKYIGKSGNKDSKKPVFTTLEITEPELKKSLIYLKNSKKNNPQLFVGLSADSLNKKLQNLVNQANTIQDFPQSSYHFTVKDFRTWAASVKTVQELILSGPPPLDLTKKDFILKTVSKKVARLLNNTVAVARKDYIDPRLLNAEAYDQLWSLFNNDFLDLKERNADKTLVSENVSITNETFDPKFEKLTLQFLQNIKK